MPFKDGELLVYCPLISVPNKFTPCKFMSGLSCQHQPVLCPEEVTVGPLAPAPQTALMCSLEEAVQQGSSLWLSFCRLLGGGGGRFPDQSGFAQTRCLSALLQKFPCGWWLSWFSVSIYLFPYFFSLSFGHFCRDLRSAKWVSSNHLGTEL